MSRKILVCDNTSVGVIAKDSKGRILLIERKIFPFGWAPPSGHCDGQTYPIACFNEFEEETGLKVVGAPRPVTLFKSKKYFKCRRGGEYHNWQIFEVDWKGELKPNRDETKNAEWFTIEEICELAEKTRNHTGRMRALSNPAIPASVVSSIIEVLEREWQANPGLEPVWYEFFQELRII